MKIIIDAFGGDNAPVEIIKGARLAKDEYKIDILLTGSKTEIIKSASDNQIDISDMEIADAPEIITMDDDPSAVIKTKKIHQWRLALTFLRRERETPLSRRATAEP